jgi:hypothetical protein
MKLRVVLDAFSGRPNPSALLTGAKAERLVEAMQRQPRAARTAQVAPPILGWRGVVVLAPDGAQSLRLPSPRVALPRARTRSTGSDSMLEDVIGAFKLPPAVRRFVRQSTVAGPLPRVVPSGAAAKAQSDAAALDCPCAPSFEPAWWNDGDGRQIGNNCYNYATNYRTDSFAQPGRGSGAMFSQLQGASVLSAALRDGLDSAPALNRCPARGQLVALVMAPGVDFHWYRRGDDGRWSHKVGPAPATNLDNDGEPILDPRLAARGPYTEFVAFLIVEGGHIKPR